MRSFDAGTVVLSGRSLIEASAGTGKTFSIAILFARMVAELGMTVDEILVVTFTKAATAELKDRLRSKLRKLLDDNARGEDAEVAQMAAACGAPKEKVLERLGAALRDFDQASIFTMHSFCERILKEYAYETGRPLEMELVTDHSEMLDEIASDFWALKTYEASRLSVDLLNCNKITIDSLTDLAKTLLNKASVELIGGEDDAAGPDESAFETAYQEARQIWSQHKDEIYNLLLESTGQINQGSYKPSHLDKYFAGVDRYLSHEKAPRFVSKDDKLFLLTTSKLQEKTKKNQVTPTHPFFDVCEQMFVEQEALESAAPRIKREFIEYLKEQLAVRKEEQGVQFFDDLISGLAQAIDDPAYGAEIKRIVAARYKGALIDEFQDTDRDQYRIFGQLFDRGEAPFFLIGDPKQSIYGFRGGDVFAYMEAAKDSDDNTYTLDVNWRSDPGMVKAASALFERSEAPFLIEEISFSPVRPSDKAKDTLTIGGHKIPAMEILFVSKEGTNLNRENLIAAGWLDNHLPDYIAADIAQLLMSGTRINDKPVAPSDIAVLVHANKQAAKIQAALRRQGIISIISGGESVFRSEATEDLTKILRAVAAPRSEGKVKAALSTTILGLSAKEIFDLKKNDDAWSGWCDHFASWRELWNSRGIVQMMDDVLSMKGKDGRTLRVNVLTGQSGERALTDIRHILEILHAQSRAIYGGPSELLRWFERQRNGSTSAKDEHLRRIESDKDAVEICTIHKSKGLQYPIVYLPYTWKKITDVSEKDNVFCHLPAGDRKYKKVLDLGSNEITEHVALANREQFAEYLRILYVAMTRAKRQVKMVWGAANGFHKSALGYLFHHCKPGENLDKFSERVKRLTDEQLLENVRRFADSTDGAVRVTELRRDNEVIYLPPSRQAETLHAAQITRQIQGDFWVSSYSALTRTAQTPSESNAPELVPASTNDAASDRVPLWDFSAGTAAGSCIHEVFENISFPDNTTVPPICNKKLDKYGYAPERFGEILGESILEILKTPLDTDKPTLALETVADNRRLVELEFMIPVKNKHPVTSNAIAAVFAAHGTTDTLRGNYAKRISAMSFRPLHGFFRGFIDLVFEHEGKFYIVDYKSNHLGETYAHYSQSSLNAAMTAHDYYLQYHLYAVALHRYLARKISDYNYEHHFGGIYYLFVRGMSKVTGPHHGVFKDRPSKEMIQNLCALL